jgi:hypothetical protein
MAIMWPVILKNAGAEVFIEELGIAVPAAGQMTASDQFRYEELASSDELRDLVLATTLVVNDGSADLSAADGVLYLTFQHQKAMADEYYTKTQLQTSGDSQVNWDNIINKPTYGVDNWADRALFRVIDFTTIAASDPVGPTTGDTYINSGDNHRYEFNGATWDDLGVAIVGDSFVDPSDNHIYKFNGTTWDDMGAATADDRVINLNDPDQSVFTFNGTTWDDGGAPDDTTGIGVDDDGDGKTSVYIYDTTGSAWVKLMDVDFVDHHNDGASKHDADQIDVEGTYTNIGAPTDAETAFGNIDTQITNIKNGDHNNTLDEAYDQDGAGVGRTITVDTGAVVLNATSGTDSPLELTPTSTMPTTNLADGQITVADDGLVYAYDATRAKWLSVHRETFVFGRRGKTNSMYLSFFGSRLASNNSGLRLLRNATIVGMSAQLDKSGTTDLSVRKNDVVTDIATLSIAAGFGASVTNLNVDVAANDYLQGYADPTGNIEDPMVIIESAFVETDFKEVIPTVCPNNNEHTIDDDTIEIIDTSYQASTTISPLLHYDNKPISHNSPRVDGTYTFITGRGDDPEDHKDVGYGEAMTLIHKEGNDDIIKTYSNVDYKYCKFYADFNCMNNISYIHDARLAFFDMKHDLASASIVPRVCTTEAGTGTPYRTVPYKNKVDAFILPADFAGGPNTGNINITNFELVQVVPNMKGEIGVGYWNADYDSDTGVFSNITPAPGNGSYNMFAEEVYLAKFVNDIILAGDGTLGVGSKDVDRIGNGMRFKICLKVRNSSDHDCSMSVSMRMYRQFTVRQVI